MKYHCLLTCVKSLSWYLPDTVIVQMQTWGVVGAQQLEGHVLLNGVSLPPTNQEVDGIIKSMSVDEHLPNVIGVNLTLVPSMNHCVLVLNVKFFLFFLMYKFIIALISPTRNLYCSAFTWMHTRGVWAALDRPHLLWWQHLSDSRP